MSLIGIAGIAVAVGFLWGCWAVWYLTKDFEIGDNENDEGN